MRRVVGLVCCAFALTSCSRSPAAAAAVSTPQSFIASAYLAATGDADVCALATRQGRLPETRSLGAATQRTLVSLRGDLQAAAQRKHVGLPKGVEEKKLALRDNLSMLHGSIFDQGYALAMVQDTRSMLQTFDAGARLGDADVRAIVDKYRSQIEGEQHDSRRLLAQLGGPPWPAFNP